jgi:hypothetical protein
LSLGSWRCLEGVADPWERRPVLRRNCGRPELVSSCLLGPSRLLWFFRIPCYCIWCLASVFGCSVQVSDIWGRVFFSTSVRSIGHSCVAGVFVFFFLKITFVSTSLLYRKETCLWLRSPTCFCYSLWRLHVDIRQEADVYWLVLYCPNLDA